MLTGTDLADLRRANALLTNPGLAMRIASYVGKPVEWGLARLPPRAREFVTSTTRSALDKALSAAIYTMDPRLRGRPANWLHRATVLGSGALGGAFGLAGLPLELPFSTTVMLRSIADHARAEGEDLTRPEARMNCLLVLALGGESAADDTADVGYFAVRIAFARAVGEAAEYLAGRMAAKQAAEKSAPALVRLVTAIAARFSISVEDKIAAQLVPAIGALGGAVINDLFITHFQEMASAHFTVRRLERSYTPEAVRSAYDDLDRRRSHPP